ncbi:hydrogenase-1 large subunit [Escherichia coli]|uniref:Hydrogenase-1 large subunit n=1 Tax=Escherichia coli TaxID=562 RepID=A0A376MUU7_ECOLX|nr:hydrogenase-1 large subunit [Escherichia coli]
MSTQYETQGYTINNAGRRLVVDPITRIEGHMRCEVNINDQNVITMPSPAAPCFAGWRSSCRARPARCVGVR